MNTKKIYVTQAELAERWRCSESTIVNCRKRGLLSYFQLPESSKILYKIADIEIIENEHQYTNKKGGDRLKQVKKSAKTELKGKPVVSENSKKDWRI